MKKYFSFARFVDRFSYIQKFSASIAYHRLHCFSLHSTFEKVLFEATFEQLKNSQNYRLAYTPKVCTIYRPQESVW